jgi:aminocarboxymuconate-semialdehyde decarboxylase
VDTGDVDVHSHFFPAGLPDLAAETGDARWPSLDTTGPARIMRGDTVFRPVAATCWQPEARLEAMDRAGTAVHVLSPVPVTLVSWAPAPLAASFLRAQNEALARTVALAPDRFRALGAVPLQDPDLAVAELHHAVHELGLAGIEIGTTVQGRELDDPVLRPFLAEAAAMGVPLFVHPVDGGGGAVRRQGNPYDFAVGMLTDTALAATALVFGGVLDDLPELRVGLAHGCGAFAWLYPRIARGASLGPSPRDVGATRELVRRLWVDSLVFDPLHLPLLFERFGPDHVMLGSDFPFYPPSFGAATDVLDGAVEAGTCTAEQAAAVRRANPLSFLARAGAPGG